MVFPARTIGMAQATVICPVASEVLKLPSKDLIFSDLIVLEQFVASRHKWVTAEIPKLKHVAAVQMST